jgi:hypothetical protein
MTFLNPAILLGLIAASIPVLLHFLNLRKLKKIEFSTLTFLKALQKTKIRRIKLKQLLLLFLRILIITSLVFAFARPTIKSLSLGSSAAKTTAVFIIDNTFSMSVVSGNGSYLNKAKHDAKLLLQNFNEGDEIAVIPVASAQSYDEKLQSNLSAVKKEIEQLSTSFKSNTLNSALVKAGQIIYESKNFNKEIYLFTDLQDGRIYNSRDELSGLKNLLNDTRIYLLNINDKEAINLGVDSFFVNNQIFEKNKPINFTAFVKNYSNNSIDNSVASLFINGKRCAQQSFSAGSGQSVKLNFETTLADTGLVETYVELEDDDINQDNKRFACFYVPDKINVLLLTDNPGDAQFIKLALSNEGSQTFSITENYTSQIASLNLSKYNAIIFIGTGIINGGGKLLNYLESGNGIILMPGSKSSIASMQSLFNNLNLPSPSNFIGQHNSSENSAGFGKIDLQNPLFQDIFESNSKSKIESPEIYYYARINPGSSGKTIIAMNDNSAFLSEFKIGAGKILIYNSAPVLSSGTFPLKSLFAPLMNKSVFYVSQTSGGKQNIFAGGKIIANIQSAANNQLKISKPNGGSEFVNTNSIANKKYFAFDGTDLTGIYKFYSGGKMIDYASVNCDPKESIVKYLSDSEFEKYLEENNFDGKIIPVEPNDNFSKTVNQSRFGTELWKYFLIFALLLAIIEMFVAKSSKKDLNGISA